MPDPRRPLPDDDLSAALPPAPPPRLDRREAAIDAAMRRFDGVGDAPRTPDSVRPDAPRWGRLDQPRLGALVAVALVVSIGVPMWMAGDHARPVPEAGRPVAVRDAAVSQRQEPDAAADVTAVIAPPSVPRRPPPTPPVAAPAVRSDGADASRRSAPSVQAAVPPPPAMFAVPVVPAPAPLVASQASEAANIVVTGSRVGRDGEGSAANERALARFSAPIARTAPTACTVADPTRDLDACRSTFDTAATGHAGKAVRDGVSLAWRGKVDRAIAAFDRAIRSDPSSAFAYYNRSLLYRRRGDVARAEVDQARANAIDSRYGAAAE